MQSLNEALLNRGRETMASGTLYYPIDLEQRTENDTSANPELNGKGSSPVQETNSSTAVSSPYVHNVQNELNELNRGWAVDTPSTATSPANNIVDNTFNPFVPYRRSNLRHEYIPSTRESNLSFDFNFDPAINFQQSKNTTSPRHYRGALFPEFGLMATAGYGFEESNERTPTQPFFNPTQMHLNYSDPQQSSHNDHEITSTALPSLVESNLDQSHDTHLAQSCATPTMSEAPARKGRTKTITQPSNPKRRFKREVTPVSSPQPARELRRSVRRTVEPSQINHSVPIYGKPDDQYLDELVNAMVDDNDAEDNQGMLSTWSKIRDTKYPKVRAKAEEMLELIKLAQCQPLGDKKAVTQYMNFEHRFQQTVLALRTQKTVCKHLMEAPYSHIVANDPTFAAQVRFIP